MEGYYEKDACCKRGQKNFEYRTPGVRDLPTAGVLEIVFGDSACGSLKVAQNYGKGEYTGGCIGVFISHEDGSRPTKEEIRQARREAEQKERLAWENAVPLGGDPGDVYGFHLALSVGEISEDGIGVQRWNALEQLYCFYPGQEGRQAAEELLEKAKQNLEEVRSRAAQGESIRIWYSDQPDELCGLYWFLAQLSPLQDRCGSVYLVKLPGWDMDGEGNVIQRGAGWGEVAPGEWSRSLTLQRQAPTAFFQMCASRWKELQKENAPLRAVLNGQLVSVPENLYDSLILREMEQEPESFREAVIIGRVLGKYRLGLSDGWIAQRIEKMIGDGKLEIVTEAAENMPAYRRVLRKKAGNCM